MLIGDCAEVDPDFAHFLEEANLLTPYYIETRYPADPPPVYSREEAQMAIGTAERIRQFMRTKLGVENNGP